MPQGPCIFRVQGARYSPQPRIIFPSCDPGGPNLKHHASVKANQATPAKKWRIRLHKSIAILTLITFI